MKFTEGYWLPSEKANASHAMQAYEVEQIPGGMRILATTRPIEHRGMTLNLPTITVEFVAHTPDTISMEAWHYEAYDNKVPSFDKTESVYEDVTVTINEDEAVLDTGSRFRSELFHLPRRCKQRHLFSVRGPVRFRYQRG